MSAIALIPARGGSVRIPRKNIRPFHGKPIILYSIEAAKASGLFDAIVVSTDDDEIAEVSRSAGAQIFIREQDWGIRGTQDVAREALNMQMPRDLCCVIYATAPLISVEDLAKAHAEVTSGRHAYCYSVHGWQDAGQFYFGQTKAFIDRVPLDHWSTAHVNVDVLRFCDINTEDDWARAEEMYLALKEEKEKCRT